MWQRAPHTGVPWNFHQLNKRYQANWAKNTITTITKEIGKKTDYNNIPGANKDHFFCFIILPPQNCSAKCQVFFCPSNRWKLREWNGLCRRWENRFLIRLFFVPWFVGTLSTRRRTSQRPWRLTLALCVVDNKNNNNNNQTSAIVVHNVMVILGLKLGTFFLDTTYNNHKKKNYNNPGTFNVECGTRTKVAVLLFWSLWNAIREPNDDGIVNRTCSLKFGIRHAL